MVSFFLLSLRNNQTWIWRKIRHMQNALDLLAQDYYLNYPLIRAIRHGAKILRADENGVIFILADDFLLLAGTNPASLIRDLDKPDLVELCGSSDVAEVAQFFDLTALIECDQFYYPYAAIESDLRLETLKPEDSSFVEEHYHRLEGDDIRATIQAGRLFGLRDHGQLFAFIGLHEDFSMGMLEVLPGYRRQGWGERLERALTAELLRRGELPYGQVIKGNQISFHLQQKLGFKLCSDSVFWMWRE